MPASPENAESWVSLLVPTLGAALLGAIVWLKSKLEGAKAEDRITPAAEIARKSIGAAFVDDSAAAALMRIDGNVQKMTTMMEKQVEHDKEQDLKESLEEMVRRVVGEKR